MTRMRVIIPCQSFQNRSNDDNEDDDEKERKVKMLRKTISHRKKKRTKRGIELNEVPSIRGHIVTFCDAYTKWIESRFAAVLDMYVNVNVRFASASMTTSVCLRILCTPHKVSA